MGPSGQKGFSLEGELSLWFIFHTSVERVHISLCQVGLIFLVCHSIFIIIGSVLKQTLVTVGSHCFVQSNFVYMCVCLNSVYFRKLPVLSGW